MIHRLKNEIEAIGLPAPEAGELNEVAYSKILAALVSYSVIVDHLSGLVDPALLLTSNHPYLRKLGEMKKEKKNEP